MFRNIKCPKCGTEIDEDKYECDLCHHKNVKKLKFKQISMLPVWKQALLFVIGFGGFQLLAYLISLAIVGIAKAQLGVGTFTYYAFINSYKYVGYVNFTCYLLIFAALAALIITNAYDVLRTFKHIRPLVAGLVGLFVILLFNIIYTSLLGVLGVTLYSNANENAINNIVYQYPVLSMLIFGLVGPIVEELTYRVGVFSFFARINKILAYVLTVTIFTLIHFDFQSSTMINELLNIPLYASAALVLSYLYDHYGFAGSVYCHVFNNVLSIATSIATLKS